MSAGNRCRCGKVIFGSRESADRAARGVTLVHRDKRHPMRAYRGACGHWHLARIKTLAEWAQKLGARERRA